MGGESRSLKVNATLRLTDNSSKRKYRKDQEVLVSLELADWVIALFLFFALVLVSRFKKQISADGPEHYNNIAGGLVILALVALARVYNGLGLFERVPFLSETVFYDLISWIGIITGATFVVSGVSNWLPLARKSRRFSEKRIRQLDLLRKTEQLVGVESRLDAVLAHVIDHMVEQFSFRGGAVYKYSTVRDRLYLTASALIASEKSHELAGIRVDRRELSAFYDSPQPNPVGLFRDLPSSMGDPSVVLPIMIGRRAVGFFLLWAEQMRVFGFDELLTLRLVADIVARKIETDHRSMYQAAMRKRAVWRQEIETEVNAGRGIRETVAAVVRRVTDRVPMDFAALAVLEEYEPRVRRYSLGQAGQVLVESELPQPGRYTLSGPAYFNGQTVMCGDVGTEHPLSKAEMLVDDSVRSVMILPIPVGGKTRAVLSLASRHRDAFSRRHREDMEYVLPVLSRLVADIKARNNLAGQLRLKEKLGRFLVALTHFESPAQAFDEAARLIFDELSPDMVRIATSEDDGAFLKSQALLSHRPYAGIVPGRGDMVVSLMPLHRSALMQGRTITVGSGGDEAEMTEAESVQVFATGIKSGLIVPLRAGKRTVGVISLACMRDSCRFTKDSTSRVFVSLVADALIAALVLAASHHAFGLTPESVDWFDSKETARRVQLRSSLSGILGSVEMLRSRAEVVADEQVKRYLSVLDRSIQKMDSCLHDRQPVN